MWRGCWDSKSCPATAKPVLCIRAPDGSEGWEGVSAKPAPRRPHHLQGDCSVPRVSAGWAETVQNTPPLSPVLGRQLCEGVDRCLWAFKWPKTPPTLHGPWQWPFHTPGPLPPLLSNLSLDTGWEGSLSQAPGHLDAAVCDGAKRRRTSSECRGKGNPTL